MLDGAYQVSGFAYQGSGAFAYQEVIGIEVPVPSGGGGGRRKKRRNIVIRYSDFESRDAYEKAFLAAAAPVIEASTTKIVEPQVLVYPVDEDDDMIISVVLSKVLRFYD